MNSESTPKTPEANEDCAVPLERIFMNRMHLGDFTQKQVSAAFYGIYDFTPLRVDEHYYADILFQPKVV